MKLRKARRPGRGRPANALSHEMTLRQLREMLHMQQSELGRKLGIKQAAVSRRERRDDIRLSHLKKAVEAMGGELVVIAHFRRMDVRLTTAERNP
jgi:transcriptional regulator with XRE-family HTH domain